MSSVNSDIAFTLFYAVYMGTFYAITIAFSVLSYILTGKSLSAIARRRGIDKPWLAWVPVGNMWLLGCISDQYRYVTYGEQTNRRTKLMWYDIAVLSDALLILIIAVSMVVTEAMNMSEDVVIAMGMLMMIPYFVLIPLAVLVSILSYKCYFDLFRSCDPDKSLVYLLVSIFTSYPLPFFLYSCRNKDLGMPPRNEVSERSGE